MGTHARQPRWQDRAAAAVRIAMAAVLAAVAMVLGITLAALLARL